MAPAKASFHTPTSFKPSALNPKPLASKTLNPKPQTLKTCLAGRPAVCFGGPQEPGNGLRVRCFLGCRKVLVLLLQGIRFYNFRLLKILQRRSACVGFRCVDPASVLPLGTLLDLDTLEWLQGPNCRPEVPN